VQYGLLNSLHNGGHHVIQGKICFDFGGLVPFLSIVQSEFDSYTISNHNAV